MKGRLRRLAFLGSGTLLFFVALWLTPGTWGWLDRWVDDQRRQAWDQVEKTVGQKVLYDRIVPTVLDALEFKNVRILSDDGTPVVTASSVRLSWDWAMVFQGQFDRLIRKIQVVNGTINLDARRDQSLLAHWADLVRQAESGPPVQFEVEGFNLAGRWSDGPRTLTLDRAFVLLSPAKDRWNVRYRGALAWQDGSPGKELYLKALVRGDLSSDEMFQNLSLRTELSQVSTPWFDLEPLTFQVTVDPKSVNFTKVADRLPFDLKAAFDRITSKWIFSGSAEEFQPAAVVHWKSDSAWTGVTRGYVSGGFFYSPGGDFSFEGRVDWPAGALPAPFNAHPVHARGAVLTDQGLYRFKGFRWDSETLALGFDGTLDPQGLVPRGTLVLDRWVLPSVGEGRGTLRLTPDGSRVDLTGEDWHWNNLGTSGPSGWVERSGPRWKFQLGGLVDRTPAGRFLVGGSTDLNTGSGTLGISLDEIPFSLLKDEVRRQIPTFDLPVGGWDLVGNIQGVLSWSPAGMSVTKTSFDFRDPARSGREGRGILGWNDRHLTIGLNSFRWDQFSCALRLDADYHGGGSVDGTLTGRLWDHPLALGGQWDQGTKTLTFSGTPGISGSVHLTEPGLWTASFAVAPLEFSPGMSLGFRGTASASDSEWTVDLEKATFLGRYPWDGEPFAVSAALKVRKKSIRIEEVTLSDSHGTLAGQGASSWSPDFSEPWAGTLELGTPETSRESISLELTGTSWDQWHFGVKAKGLDLGRAGPALVQGVQGRLALDGTAEWTGLDLLWSAQASLSEARWGDSPLGFRALVSGNLNRVSVRNLNLSVNPLRITDGVLDLDTRAQTWNSNLTLGVRLGTGDWQAQWAASGTWTPGGGDFELRSKGNTWVHNSFPDWDLVGRWASDGWFAALADGGMKIRGFPDGAFQVETHGPFPVEGTAAGTWRAGNLILGVKGFHADLGLIKSSFNSKPFSVLGGSIEGDFTVQGALSDPETNGRMVLKGLRFSSSFIKTPLGPIDVPVNLEGHTVRIDPVNLGPKGQTWLVSARATLDHFLPETYEILVQTDTFSVIPAVYEGAGLAAVGGVTGYFAVRGNPLSVNLEGKLVCQDTSITLKDSKGSPGQGNSVGFNVDLTLVTGRKVEFLWPNESLPLIRAVTATGQTLVIRTNDVASTWSVTGKMALKTGEINYLNQTFVLKEGTLGFQESQTHFDPTLSVRAELKVPEPNGLETVNLHADGTLATFSPRFDASPYMSPNDLQQLLGITLALPSDYTKPTNVNTALSLASDLGTSMLLSPFEQLVRRNFQLDLFTVRTEILKKTFLNRNGSLEASDYLDNTRLFFGKYIGDDLFLQGTLAFSQDPLAVTQGSQQLIAEPEFQMEFQTPFFLLNWTLEPLHPETLFVTDNTVTLRWNWSY